MKKLPLAGILFLLLACSDKRPQARCSDAGSFVMTLKNEPGIILPDSSGKFYIHFSPDGSLKSSARAYPCNLAPDFQTKLNVYFDGDFYEYSKDPSTNLIVYIRDMDYR